jgi:hypothetical protein
MQTPDKVGIKHWSQTAINKGQEYKRTEEDAEIATRGAYFAIEIFRSY